MAEVVIIGGGIVGLSSAYYLQKKGYTVTILDKGDLNDNCSYGNAGMIVPSHFVPLASPGMVQQGVRWMFNSKSPFYVKPSLNGKLIGWGLKFLKSANANHVAKSAVPLRDLSLLSKDLYHSLADELSADFELQDKGILAFYKTEKAAEEEAHLVKKALELGLDMAILNPAECAALQPSLKLDVLGAVHYRCDSHLYPQKLMDALLAHLQQNGVKIIRNHEVTKIELTDKRITSVLAGGVEWKADHFVLATGSWSPEIAKMVDMNIPIMPGKGYSFMEAEPQQRMQIPALLCEARVAITPMNGSIRYGGTMELGPLNNKINTQRVLGIVESVPKYFPDLKPAVPSTDKIWFGFRPSSPDGLPYIGYSHKAKNLVIATGHGMMGLSLGPATGSLVSQLIADEQPDLKLGVFSPSRFN